MDRFNGSFEADIDSELEVVLKQRWVKKLDYIYRKDHGGPEGHFGGTYGESTTVTLIKIFLYLIKYQNLNPKSVFSDLGSGLGKPNVAVRQLEHGPTTSIGIEDMVHRVNVRCHHN